MSGSDRSGPTEVFPTPNQRIAFEEGRAVLNAQRATLSDIDDKAMRLLRVTAVIIGAFVALARVEGPDVFNPTISTTGSLCLFVSVSFAALTYSESTDFVFGPQREYIGRLDRNRFPGSDWSEDYLAKLGYWVEENADIIRLNAVFLDVANVMLILGLGLLTLSIPY